MTVKTRPATPDDIAKFYPDNRVSFRAWVVEYDGNVEGFVGVVLTRPCACLVSAFNEVIRPYLPSVAVMRIIRKAKIACDKIKSPVVAIADPNEPTSPILLSKLGFTYFDEIDGDKVYRFVRRDEQ